MNSSLIEFFLSEMPDSEGRYLEDILRQDDCWFEYCHDYVQWLFPLKEPSEYNPDAPILTDDDIEYFNGPNWCLAKFNYLKCMTRMMSFFGLEIILHDANSTYPFKAYVDLAENFDERKHTWAEEFNHNHLRMTRMLTSMILLGFGYYARAIFDILKDFARYRSSLIYWEKALCPDTLLQSQ